MRTTRGARVLASAIVVVPCLLVGCSTQTGAARSEDTAPAAATSAPAAPLLVSPSAVQQRLTTSSFEVGAMVPCVVKEVTPLLVRLTCDGQAGVIRGAAYEKVKAGDRVIVRVTVPIKEGRFEGTLVKVSSAS